MIEKTVNKSIKMEENILMGTLPKRNFPLNHTQQERSSSPLSFFFSCEKSETETKSIGHEHRPPAMTIRIEHHHFRVTVAFRMHTQCVERQTDRLCRPQPNTKVSHKDIYKLLNSKSPPSHVSLDRHTTERWSNQILFIHRSSILPSKGFK